MTQVKRPMINEALRLLRLYLGISQKKLAEELELSQSMISEIESGVKQVSMEVLERYSERLDVKMSKLIFFSEELEENPSQRRGKLIVGSNVLKLLDKLAPREVADAS